VAKKYKITRKQIKQDDKFLAAIKDVTKKIVVHEEGETNVDWMRYLKIGVTVLSILVLIGGAVFGFSAYRAKKAERLMAQADVVYRAPIVTEEEYKANPQYASIGAYIDKKKKWSDAVDQFNVVVKKYPGSKYGVMALLNLGNCYYELGEYQEAIGNYQKYLDKVGLDDPFASLARQSMAYAFEALGDLGKAEEIYTSLTGEEGSTIAVMSLLDLARVYEQKNELDKAIGALDRVVQTEQIDSPSFYKLKRRAEGKLQMLKARTGKEST